MITKKESFMLKTGKYFHKLILFTIGKRTKGGRCKGIGYNIQIKNNKR